MMKLLFSSQPYQQVAVDAIVYLLRGEGDQAQRNVRYGSMLMESVGNTLPTPIEHVQINLHTVQRRNHLPLTDDAEQMSFCVEMETGTGKTYVYLKTIHELYAPTVRRGGIEAMKQHIRAGEPMVSWRDGKVVMLTPEELTAMLERYKLEDAQT